MNEPAERTLLLHLSVVVCLGTDDTDEGIVSVVEAISGEAVAARSNASGSIADRGNGVRGGGDWAGGVACGGAHTGMAVLGDPDQAA